MMNETEATGGREAPERAWRPSGRPEYAHNSGPSRSSGRVVERKRSKGWLGWLTDCLKLPAVKAVIGVSLFVLAAIVYDATINGGSWTERPEKPKATQKERRQSAR